MIFTNRPRRIHQVGCTPYPNLSLIALMTEAIKYISRYNSESPLPGVLELYAQSYLSTALRELFRLGLVKAADGWLWGSGFVQLALMPLQPSEDHPRADGGEDDRSLRGRLRQSGKVLGRLLFALLQVSDRVVSFGASTVLREVVGIVWLFIERSHLLTTSAGMSENFFGLKRAGILNPRGGASFAEALGFGGGSTEQQAVAADHTKVFGSDIVFFNPLTSSSSLGAKPELAAHTNSMFMSRFQYYVCLFQLGAAPYLMGKLTDLYVYFTSDNVDTIDARKDVVREYLRKIETAGIELNELIDAANGEGRAPGTTIISNDSIQRKVIDAKRKQLMMAKLRYTVYRLAVKVFLALFPVVSAANQGLRAVFLTAYALERTPYFTFLQWVGKVGVRRAQMQDQMVEEGAKVASSATRRMLIRAGAIAVPLMFLLVRYQSWRRDQQHAGGQEEGLQLGPLDGSSTSGDNALKVPPPQEASMPLASNPTAPPSLANSPARSANNGGDVEGECEGRCPVCSSITVNPAVLITSGVVGCFTCLHTFVTENKKCPRTSVPCTTVHVRRLYE